jgi:hypothetical protein
MPLEEDSKDIPKKLMMSDDPMYHEHIKNLIEVSAAYAKGLPWEHLVTDNKGEKQCDSL